ncbi:MAG: DNA topology modulation protein [Actinomycetota bacterium]
MRKILVIGSGGAGKSTFAKRLSEETGIEVIHLDRIYWRAGWTQPPKDEWRKTVENLLKGKEWIMDGNFGGTMEMRLAACDAAIFLDLPRHVCLYRILKRRLTYRNTNRPDMTEGCHEKIDFKFLKWIWDYPKKNKPAVEAKLKLFEKEKTIIRLKSNAEVEDFLAKLQAKENC